MGYKTPIAAGLLLGSATMALAGSSTIVVKDGNSASQTYDVTTDGSAHFITQNAIVDGTNGANVATVNSNNSLLMDANTSSQIHTDLTASVPAGTNRIGYASDDPCAQKVKTNFAIGTAGALNIQAVAPSGSTKVYVCSLNLIAGGAASFNVIEGLGTTCSTAALLAVIGSTTASNGLALAANGGLTLGNGAGTIGVTATAGNGICVSASSSSVQYAGSITYVQQ